MQVWLNGAFVDAADAKISVFDAGFQHAVGLFETISAANGRAFRAHDHMQRLVDSARDLALTERLRVPPLVDAINLTLKKNKLERARVRVTVTGGDLNRPLQESTPNDPTVLIVAQPPTPYPREMFNEGVRAIEAMERDAAVTPMAGHKTINYWARIQTLQRAAAYGAGEAIWFSVSGQLSAGAVSNAFIVRDGVLLTPFARGEEEPGMFPSAARPGVTRAAVIELADAADIEVRRANIQPEEVVHADEMFLTNASWGVLPVVGVGEDIEIGNGKVGPVTRQMRDAWLALVETETSA